MVSDFYTRYKTTEYSLFICTLSYVYIFAMHIVFQKILEQKGERVVVVVSFEVQANPKLLYTFYRFLNAEESAILVCKCAMCVLCKV